MSMTLCGKLMTIGDRTSNIGAYVMVTLKRFVFSAGMLASYFLSNFVTISHFGYYLLLFA